MRLIFDIRKGISFKEGLFLVGKVKRRNMTFGRKGEQKSDVILMSCIDGKNLNKRYDIQYLSLVTRRRVKRHFSLSVLTSALV